MQRGASQPADGPAAARAQAAAPPTTLELPRRLRIGPWQLRATRVDDADTVELPSAAQAALLTAAIPAASVEIRPYDSPPQLAAALFYPAWSEQGCRVQGRNFYCDIAFDGPRLTWWWPRRHWQSAASALWDLSVLASTQALALRRGGLLLHGAALVIDGEAVVVSGPSGAGKSTLAARFAGAVLHDDVIALAPDQRSPSGWAAWSQDGSRAPSGDLPGEVPLRRLLLFSGDRAHTLSTPILAADALGELAAQTYFAGGAATAPLMAQLAQLVAAVPLGRLSHCLGDSTAAVRAALRGQGPW